jgi:hypothetical protein
MMTAEQRAKAEMASLTQAQIQIADQLATNGELAGRQKTVRTGQQDALGPAMIAAASWLVFEPEEPPPPPGEPVRWSRAVIDRLLWMLAADDPIGTVH